MPTPFKFLPVDLPPDGDLRLILAERLPATDNLWGVPAYSFHLQSRHGHYMGRLRLRVGWNDNIIRYAGHIGYAVEPLHRGHHYAERACRLILPLAKQHGMESLWITCQPDNIPSRRTLERLGAECMGAIEVPPEYPLDAGAQRQKMCFRLRLE